jgi:hypothetical protein
LVFEVDKKVTQSKIFDTIKSMMEKNEWDISLKVEQKNADNWGDLK